MVIEEGYTAVREMERTGDNEDKTTGQGQDGTTGVRTGWPPVSSTVSSKQ